MKAVNISLNDEAIAALKEVSMDKLGCVNLSGIIRALARIHKEELESRDEKSKRPGAELG